MEDWNLYDKIFDMYKRGNLTSFQLQAILVYQKEFIRMVLDIILDDVSNLEKYKLIKDLAGSKLTGGDNENN